ncbi:nucleolar protein 12-domain-containing protein [Scheffersomyces xylosifermentans]|uniref:nucleolar protein 12-domain-containing protein n=1 Tax=Scheffersomyces xylosifermentans TaxID=1304137 RepID=UPI00315D1807
MSGGRKNRDILTGGKKYAQKQAKKHRVEEVVFDKESREEYLTGFHKRKVQRQKKAQEYIKEQERLARIEERRQMREERKKDMENQLKDFNETVKKITTFDVSDDEDEKWTGFDENEQDSDDSSNEEPGSKSANKPENRMKGILHHTEIYKLDETTQLLPESNAIIDEETTVEVESLDNPATLSAQEASLEAIARANNVRLEDSEKVLESSLRRAKSHAMQVGITKPSFKDRVKQKKKKFRYLSKAERRENTRKERSKGNKFKKEKKEKGKPTKGS